MDFKTKAEILKELAGIEDCDGGKGIRFYGEFIPEENAIIYDLNNY